MLKYEYIKKEWIVSPTARRVYRASATLSVALFFGRWAILVVGRIPETVAPAVRLLLLVGVLGAGITVVGMELFLFRFDELHPLKQVFWFLVMLLPLLGAPYTASWFTPAQMRSRAPVPRSQRACHRK